MKRIGEEQKMTVKEVTEALGTAESTIRNKAKELYPETVENGKPTLLTGQQVYEIKKAIVPRDLTLKSKLEYAVTSLDEENILAQFIRHERKLDEHDRDIAEIKRQLEDLKKRR